MSMAISQSIHRVLHLHFVKRYRFSHLVVVVATSENFPPEITHVLAPLLRHAQLLLVAAPSCAFRRLAALSHLRSPLMPRNYVYRISPRYFQPVDTYCSLYSSGVRHA